MPRITVNELETMRDDFQNRPQTQLGPIPLFVNHPDLGYIRAEAVEVGDSSDEQVRATIALMKRYAIEDAGSLPVRSALGLACRLYGCANVVDAVYRWVRSSCRFVNDEQQSAFLQSYDKRPIVEILLRPVEMLHFRRGDCDDFSMLAASMLLAAGVDCAFVTVAAEPATPRDYSHVYVAAYPAGGRIAVDASHGPHLGWEVPSIGRRDEWSVRRVQ